MNLSPCHEIPSKAADPNSTSAAAHILVVDDDEGVRLLEAAILKRVGHTVDIANDGASAWHLLLAGNYDLLVTDYLMPGISGLALVRQLRVASMALPVVMVSGTLESLDTVRLSRDPWTHIHAFVRKPFPIADFMEAVNGALAIGSRLLAHA